MVDEYLTEGTCNSCQLSQVKQKSRYVGDKKDQNYNRKSNENLQSLIVLTNHYENMRHDWFADDFLLTRDC